MLLMVQFSSAKEGNHCTMTVPSSFFESLAVAFRTPTSSSLMCQVPFSSGCTSWPPLVKVGAEMVGGMLRTVTSLKMVVVSPSSSVATAVMLMGPSNMGVKVQVDWVMPSSHSRPGHVMVTC